MFNCIQRINTNFIFIYFIAIHVCTILLKIIINVINYYVKHNVTEKT